MQVIIPWYTYQTWVKTRKFHMHTSTLITPTHVVLLLRFLEPPFPLDNIKYLSRPWTNLHFRSKVGIVTQLFICIVAMNK